MDDALFATFNYLSAAISQAYAALIALTAMFYVYRESKLRQERNEYGRRIRAKFASAIAGLDDSKGILTWLEQFTDFEFTMQLAEIIAKKNDPPKLKKPALSCNREIREALITQYFLNTYRKKVWTPILLSAITMAVAISFLCLGRLCLESPSLLWILMITETALALVALTFIVCLIKRLVEEPPVKSCAEEIVKQATKDYEKEKAKKEKKDSNED